MLGLRILVILLLTLWAMRPALEYRRKEDVKTVVLFCADTSSSMQRRDGAGPAAEATPPRGEEGITRIDALRKALRSREGDLADLAAKADLELAGFAATASDLKLYAPSAGWSLEELQNADGTATAIGDSLSEAYDLLAAQQRKVSAVLVFSDGCNNTADVVSPAKLAALMGSRGVPIHAVGVGSDRITAATKTLTVRDLSTPDEVEAFNRLPITAVVETLGLPGQKIKVTCRFGQEEIGTETLAVDQMQSTQPVRFVHVTLQAGFHRVSVTAEVVGSAVRDLAGRPNDSKLVHVVDREMRVLYVEGKFRYEAKYIAQALVAARRFTLDRRVLIQGAGGAGEKRSSPLSENLDDWLAYHAIIFGDVEAAQFTAKQLEIVRDLVSKYGKGFCMIGGSKSFGRGGWGSTPIADVLPVDVAGSNLQIDAPVKIVPTREGRDSDVMHIGAAETGENVAADWDKLDPLPGANRLGAPKPGAVILAEAPPGAPMIVTQQYGKGRSMAIAFDTTWRWVLNKKDTADSQRRFWRQVAMFLAAPKGTAWIVTDRTNYDIQRLRRGTEVVKITAGVEDPSGRPLLDVPVVVKLITPDKKESPVALAKGDKMRQGQIPPPAAAGTYTLKLEATVAGKPLTAEHRFDVLQRDLESLEVLANHDLLRRMSAASGGKFVTLDHLSDLLSDLRITTKPEKRDTVTHVQLSSELRWPAILAAIVLLCAEWAWRKRKGLV
jgi:uncharacterized membrane protein